MLAPGGSARSAGSASRGALYKRLQSESSCQAQEGKGRLAEFERAGKCLRGTNSYTRRTRSADAPRIARLSGNRLLTVFRAMHCQKCQPTDTETAFGLDFDNSDLEYQFEQFPEYRAGGHRPKVQRNEGNRGGSGQMQATLRT